MKFNTIRPLYKVKSDWLVTTYDIKLHLEITNKYTNTHKIVGIDD